MWYAKFIVISGWKADCGSCSLRFNLGCPFILPHHTEGVPPEVFNKILIHPVTVIHQRVESGVAGLGYRSIKTFYLHPRGFLDSLLSFHLFVTPMTLASYVFSAEKNLKNLHHRISWNINLTTIWKDFFTTKCATITLNQVNLLEGSWGTNPSLLLDNLSRGSGRHLNPGDMTGYGL